LPDSWQFDGNVDKPTFSPSFKHEGMKTIRDDKGRWTGEWEYDSHGKPMREICHYILTNGILHYCTDCTHSMAGQSIPMAELPPWHQDE